MEPTTTDLTPTETVPGDAAAAPSTPAAEPATEPTAPKQIKPLFKPNNPKDTKLGKRHQSATKARPKRRVKQKTPAKSKKKKR